MKEPESRWKVSPVCMDLGTPGTPPFPPFRTPNRSAHKDTEARRVVSVPSRPALERFRTDNSFVCHQTAMVSGSFRLCLVIFVCFWGVWNELDWICFKRTSMSGMSGLAAMVSAGGLARNETAKLAGVILEGCRRLQGSPSGFWSFWFVRAHAAVDVQTM